MPLRFDPLLGKLAPLRKIKGNKPLGFSVAVVGVVLSIALREWIDGVAAIGTFVTFYPAVIIAASIGGFWPGMLSALMSLLAADYFFVPPLLTLQLTPEQFGVMALFGFNLSLIVGVIGLLHLALERLWQQESNLRFILDSEPAGLIAVDATGVITLVNEAIAKQLGYSREDLIGNKIECLLPERYRQAHSGHFSSYMRQPEPRLMGAGRDLYATRRDGKEIPVEIGLTPIQREGKLGALAVVLDITERKYAESRQAVLVHEVQHRAANLLAIVQALMLRALTPDRPVAEARRLLFGNLAALARTQEILSEKHGAATIADIVGRETQMFGQQVSAGGDEAWLNNRSAQNISLIVHELCTNAVKHGALSRSDGQVAVTWIHQDDQLLFTWTERNGPAVPGPSRSGFGKSMLRDVASYMGATVELLYAPEGFQYKLILPHSALTTAIPMEKGMA